ncbi:MAG: thioredoxin family protein [Bacteroidota bacterium]|nr:thioredoxin family protein [Bacteroidota bacterium]
MDILKLTQENWKSELEANPNMVIKFYADWCGNCRLIAPKFKKLAGEVKFEHVAFTEVDAETNKEMRDWVGGVDNLPYFAVVKDGKVVHKDFTSKIENVEKMANSLISEN